MAEYKEINAALVAENPEFRIAWDAVDHVLRNEFIETCDEYGISRFEKILNIYPSEKDTIESRKLKVQSKWFDYIPYTEKMLYERLVSLCGKNNFIIEKKYDCYRVELEVSLELFGQTEELEHMIELMMPCNMTVFIKNKIHVQAEGAVIAAGGACAVETYFITNDFNEQIKVDGTNFTGSGIVLEEFIEISSD